MNKPMTIDLIHAMPADAPVTAARTSAVAARIAARRGAAEPADRSQHPRKTLPATELAIYEAGGGSTSFLPLNVLRRAHVTVVDIDEDQIRNNDYAQEAILGDIQTHRFRPTASISSSATT